MCVFWLSFLTSMLVDVGLLYQAVFIAKEENIPHCVVGCLLAHGLFNAYFGKNRNINLVWRGAQVIGQLFANISASVQFCLIEHVKAFISRAQYFGYTAKTGPAPCQARQRGGRSWKQHRITVGGPNELAIQRLAYTSSISCNIDLWG